MIYDVIITKDNVVIIVSAHRAEVRIWQRCIMNNGLNKALEKRDNSTVDWTTQNDCLQLHGGGTFITINQLDGSPVLP